MNQTALAVNPGPLEISEDAADEDERRRYAKFQEAVEAANARRASEGLPPLAQEKIERQWALDEEIRKRREADDRRKAQEEEKGRQELEKCAQAQNSLIARLKKIQEAARARAEVGKELCTPPMKEAEAPSLPPKDSPAPGRNERPLSREVLKFPVFPNNARPIVNEIASSALFAAIQGKDRKLLNDAQIVASGDTYLLFSGEQLNQDDHDVFMQLVSVASTRPAGEYVTVSAHSLLKALARGTGGKQHQQLEAEIRRMTKVTIEVKTKRYSYIGHLIHDAVKDEVSKQWVYRLNETLVPLYGASCYTLIDWEQRKRLKGKDLARWLQLEIARHAVPFPVKVETLRARCGSTAKELRDFRRSLRQALETLKDEGHIAAWRIDENDLVHVDRGNAISASQRRSLAPPARR